MSTICLFFQLVLSIFCLANASQWVSKDELQNFQKELENMKMFMNMMEELRENNRNLKLEMDVLKLQNNRPQEETRIMREEMVELAERDKRINSVLRKLQSENDHMKTTLSKHSVGKLKSEEYATQKQLDEEMGTFVSDDSVNVTHEGKGYFRSGNILKESNLRLASKSLSSMSYRLRGVPTPDAHTIAFSAYITHFLYHFIGLHHVFVYDVIQCNEGNAYNKNNGMFTAPVDGIYAFVWTFAAEGSSNELSEGHGDITTKLVLKSTPRACMHTDTETEAEESEATGFVILHVNVGDVVYIRSGIHVRGTFQLSYMKQWTFSGWKL